MKKKISWLAGLLPGLLLSMAVCSSVNCQNAPDPEYELIAPLPSSLLSNEGIVIENARDWGQIRREELLELFRSNVYGRVPETEYKRIFKKVYKNQ